MDGHQEAAARLKLLNLQLTDAKESLEGWRTFWDRSHYTQADYDKIRDTISNLEAEIVSVSAVLDY